MPNVKPQIIIQTQGGPKRVRTQWANKKWAVHRTYLRQGGATTKRCWTLTHRASGQAIVKHIDWRDARVLIGELESVACKYDGIFTDGMCGCEEGMLDGNIVHEARKQ